MNEELKVVNIGISTFADDLENQGTKVVRVAWKPPADGDEELLDILDKLGG